MGRGSAALHLKALHAEYTHSKGCFELNVNKKQKGENGFSFVFVWAISRGWIIHMCLSVLFSVSLYGPNSAVTEYNEAATQLTCPAASKRSHAGEDHISPMTRAEKHTSRPTLMHINCILMK